MDAPFPAGMVEEIEAFLAIDHERPSGLDIYDGVFATQTFFPLQRQAEMRDMIKIARAVEPRVVMEIGADKGGSVYHWCKCLPTVNCAIACEIRGCPYADAFDAAFGNRIAFFWLEDGSRDPGAVEFVRLAISGRSKIDVLFIDGDKGAFEKDFDAYLPLMSERGVVFFHDVNEHMSPMDQAFRRASVGRRSRRIVDVSDTEKALARERQGLPPANPHEGWLRHWKGRSCGVGVVWLGKE